MNLVFFTHPAFFVSQSMPRFANMLIEDMKHKGHTVEVWSPKPIVYKTPLPASFKKWLGYIDQFIVFPKQVRRRLRNISTNTLFIFTDQALGPWVPLVKDRFHVIHCHDFLAQRSASREISQNRTGRSGQVYQSFIRNGYRQGKNFISVSQKTREDLHLFLGFTPELSVVVYNGLNQAIRKTDSTWSRNQLREKINRNLEQGYILHVGGNQWYKNRVGVIEIYNIWREKTNYTQPLLLIGETPDMTLLEKHQQSQFKKDIHFIDNANDNLVATAYSGATLLLFPSLAEGFGWPIAEAMAHGCPVVTTNEAPMTEVAGEAGFFIPLKPDLDKEIAVWNNEVCNTIEKVVSLSPEKRKGVILNGMANASRFQSDEALNKIEMIYKEIVNKQG